MNQQTTISIIAFIYYSGLTGITVWFSETIERLFIRGKPLLDMFLLLAFIGIYLVLFMVGLVIAIPDNKKK